MKVCEIKINLYFCGWFKIDIIYREYNPYIGLKVNDLNRYNHERNHRRSID